MAGGAGNRRRGSGGRKTISQASYWKVRRGLSGVRAQAGEEQGGATQLSRSRSSGDTHDVRLTQWLGWLAAVTWARC